VKGTETVRSRKIAYRLTGAVFLLLVAIVCGCAGNAQPTGRQDITAQNLQSMIADGDPIVLLDVRTVGEYEGGHIPNSANHPVEDIDTWWSTLDAQARTVAICQAGGRSARAADRLVEEGFTSVYNLLGGMNGWTGRQDITAQALENMIADGDPIILLDVRTVSEYEGGHIPNSVNHPVEDIDIWWSTLEAQARTVAVCRAGGRSASAADRLVEEGFTSVYNLLGGMNGWTGAVTTD